MSGRPRDRHEERAEQARRDLERMHQQEEKILGAGSPDNPGDQHDAAEIWGKRLGRGLGFAALAYLVYYLLGYISLK